MKKKSPAPNPHPESGTSIDAAPLSQPDIRMLMLDHITPSEKNTRRIKPNDPAIAELAISIKAMGLLQPVVVRELASSYELLAGRRRYEACKLAGLVAIPASVVDATDDQAMEITVLENLQREALTPMEDARAIVQLMESGRTAEDIANRIGRTATWVRRRASLANLLPQIITDVERGGENLGGNYRGPYWWNAPIAVLEMVCLHTADTQAKIYTEYRDGTSVKQITAALERTLLRLSHLGWKKDKRFMADHCDVCLKRSDAQTEMFPEFSADPRCLDGTCWASLMTEYVRIVREKAAKSAGVEPSEVKVAGSMVSLSPDMSEHEGIPCKRTEPGAFPVVVVSYEGHVKSEWMRKWNSGCTNPDESAAPSVTMRRRAAAVKSVAAEIEVMDAPTDLRYVASLAAAFGTTNSARYCGSGKSFDKMQELSPADICKTLFCDIRPVLISRLNYGTVGKCTPQFIDAIRTAELLGLDWDIVVDGAASKVKDKTGEHSTWHILTADETDDDETNEGNDDE